MSLKLFLLVLILATCNAEGGKKSVRQKRLLFYDEEGNLVKTFKNPYSLDFIHNAEKVPFFGSFHNMFRPKTLGVPTVYMIPVSEQVIQQINNDPMYQNKLLTMPRKDLVIEPNTLCSGKRTQIAAKSCRSFLNCWDGWAFEQECPEGLLFAKEGYCDYPHNVDCSSRTNDAAPAPPTSPQCHKDFEAFRSEQNCNEFYICVERSPVKFRCPADLAYNQELGVCDYAYRVNCGGTSMTHDEMIIPGNLPALISQDEPIIQANPPTIPPASISQPALPPAPSIPQISQSPSCILAPAADQMPSAPAPQPPSASIQGSGDAMTPKTDSKTVVTTNSEYNTQSWSSSHVAISRQDAIRQLRLGSKV